MPDDPQTTDPWRETVRDIYDKLLFHKGKNELATELVRLIQARHAPYFCEGKTLEEWKELERAEKQS